MALIDISDILPGSGDITGDPIYGVLLFESFLGSGSISASSLILSLIVGGQASGSGNIQDELDEQISGTLQGQGDVNGSLVVSSIISGHTLGFGDISESVPLPLQGFGNLYAYMDVIPLPRAICPPCVPRSFSWRYEFTSGDLTLKICDVYGNPYSPFVVLYALYQILPGGYKKLVGPPNRRPVMQNVGCYYATGTAGECGQPGNWCIVWRWQKTPSSPVVTSEECFTIKDQVALLGCDVSPRVKKYGWDC
jgi:hypothetical protein